MNYLKVKNIEISISFIGSGYSSADKVKDAYFGIITKMDFDASFLDRPSLLVNESRISFTEIMKMIKIIHSNEYGILSLKSDSDFLRKFAEMRVNLSDDNQKDLSVTLTMKADDYTRSFLRAIQEVLKEDELKILEPVKKMILTNEKGNI